MYNKRKAKWFPLISIGLLMVVLPSFIEHMGSWHVTELYKGILMGTGIGLEIIALIFIRRDRMQTKQQ